MRESYTGLLNCNTILRLETSFLFFSGLIETLDFLKHFSGQYRTVTLSIFIVHIRNENVCENLKWDQVT